MGTSLTGDATAFGTLMALEPTMGLLLGLLAAVAAALGDRVAGIDLVVLPGAGAQRGGRRTAPERGCRR